MLTATHHDAFAVLGVVVVEQVQHTVDHQERKLVVGSHAPLRRLSGRHSRAHDHVAEQRRRIPGLRRRAGTATTLVGLPALARSAFPMVSDFWLALAIANMATITTCAWLAAADVRRRRALVYPIIVSKLVSSATGILLFVRWTLAFPFLATALVDLPIAIILVSALRAAPPERA